MFATSMKGNFIYCVRLAVYLCLLRIVINFLTFVKCLQEYSRGTTVSTTVKKFSRPYLSPSKKIPEEYLTTTEPIVTAADSTEEDTRKEISNILAGFSFNDLEHEGSASNRIDVSHAEVK